MLETDFAKHRLNVGLIAENTIAMVHSARLLGETPDIISFLMAEAHIGGAMATAEWLLTRPKTPLREALLERIQTALHAHYLIDRTWARTLRAKRLADEGLLALSFEPESPGTLTPRGRHVMGSIFDDQKWLTGKGQIGRFVQPEPPATDAQFAPIPEQLRVYRSVMDLFERELASQRDQALPALESARLFREFAERDDADRIAPALSMFSLADTYLMLELHSEAQKRAILVTLGVFRHHARHGGWPALLELIDEDLLPIDPIDPYTGEHFGYSVKDGLPIIWSAGPDRDDDGGRPFEPIDADVLGWPSGMAWFTLNEWEAMTPEQRAPFDGDIVHFPPASND